MSKEIRWLWTESKSWVERGLLTGEQAAQIRGLYPTPKEGLPWSLILFSGFGSIIAGLGVILLLAYNWDALHRFAKLGIILGGMAGFHAVGLSLFQRSDRWRQLGEALSLLGTMLFGAGIWLIAQTYHIDEHFPNGFLIWGVGAMALAWALPSVAHGLLGVVVLSIWGCSESWGFDITMPWAWVFVLGGGAALAWRLESPLLLATSLLGFGFALTAAVGVVDEELIIRVLLSGAAALVAAGLLVRQGRRFPASASIWAFFGWTTFLVCLYLLTFPEIVDDLLGGRGDSIQPADLKWVVGYGWIGLAMALALWGWIAFRRRSMEPWGGVRFEHWLLPLCAGLAQVLAATPESLGEWQMAGAFNLVFLAIAAAWMARGCTSGELKPVVLGSVLLVALATARFFDLFDSLALRGLAFLLVGVVLGAEGVLFRRARRHNTVEAL